MPSPTESSGSTSIDRAQPYKSSSGCSKGECNNNNNQVANLNQGSSDLSMAPWSGLNLDQLRMEWSGTDPSSKEYTISTYLPQGLNPSDMSISVDERNRMLTLQCQTKNHQEQKDENGTFYASQDSASFTSRSFTLPEDVDLSGIKATKNTSGGFQLHLPKTNSQGQQQQGGQRQIALQ